MLSPVIAHQLSERGHDVLAVAADPTWRGRSDEEILLLAAEQGRIVVTMNIRDFATLHRARPAAGRRHTGLAFLAPSAFPQDAGFIGAVVVALHTAASTGVLPGADTAAFLTREAEVR